MFSELFEKIFPPAIVPPVSTNLSPTRYRHLARSYTLRVLYLPELKATRLELIREPPTKFDAVELRIGSSPDGKLAQPTGYCMIPSRISLNFLV